MSTERIRVIWEPDTSRFNKAEKAIKSADKTTDKLKESTEKYKKEVKSAGDQGAKSFLNFKTIISAISFAAIIAGVRALASRVTNITAEFQKLQAVLETTLGSKSQAQLAFAQIIKFASETPFQVTQLTASFVKLANQGFKPTTNQLRNLGDLAASTGKDFDQLAEAIIDAQTGEFERLKEFGIRAAKQGDQVTFTFKGVETQVQFTADAIREYIVALGQAEGVSGSMSAISETLGGQLSNLSDSFDQFFFLLGKQASDAFTPIGLVAKAMSLVNAQLRSAEDTDLLKVAEKYDELFNTFDIENTNNIDVASSRLTAVRNVIASLEEKSKNLYSSKYIRQLGIEIDAYKAIEVDLIKIIEEEQDKTNKRTDAIDRANAAARESSMVVSELIGNFAKLQDFELAEDFRKWADSIKNDFMPAMVDLNDVVESTFADGDEVIKRRVETEQEAANKSYDAWKQSYEQRKELEQTALQSGIDVIEQLLLASVTAREVDFSSLQEQKEKELELAGNNEEAKTAIEKRFREKEKQAEQEAAKRRKKAQLQQILITNALGIARAVAAAPPPINIPLIAIQAALGLAQYAIASSTPAFKDGVIDLQGPGTGTSDSISARLSRGESVITAANTKRSKEVLEAIQAGKLDDKTYKLMMNGNIMNPAYNQFDDSRIVGAINKNRPPDIIKQGTTLYEVRSKGENVRQKIRKSVLS